MLTLDTDFDLVTPRTPTTICLAALKHRITKTRESALHALTSGCDRRPFIIVTPRGLVDFDVIAERLFHLGVTVASKETIAPWPEASSLLTGKIADDASLLRVFAAEAAWSSICDNGDAQRWNLAHERDLMRVIANEAEMRELVPSAYGQVACAGQKTTVGLHALHVPRPETWAMESAMLDVFMKNLSINENAGILE